MCPSKFVPVTWTNGGLDSLLDSTPSLLLSQSSSLISNATATALLSLGSIDYCLHVLKSLLEFWKSQQGEEEPVAASQLLRPHTATSPPDMSPFFLRQYVKVDIPGRSSKLLPSSAAVFTLGYVVVEACSVSTFKYIKLDIFTILYL